jgi:hypothetical protein
MADIVSLRQALLELHRQLLEAQRIEAERFGGRMSASEVLQAATEDLRFSWLRELSDLVATLDEARADEHCVRRALPARAPRPSGRGPGG